MFKNEASENRCRGFLMHTDTSLFPYLILLYEWRIYLWQLKNIRYIEKNKISPEKP